MDPERAAETDRAASIAAIGILAGAGVAVSALILAAVVGDPYLGSDSLNPFIVVFAIGLFSFLGGIPFAANSRIVARSPERTDAWERSMLVWGAVALPLLAVGAALVFGGSFSPESSLASAAGLILMIEAGLVVAVLSIWLVSG